MSKADRTKAFIIEKSAPLFNKKGYAGTAISDIIQATGLTKGAIYGNFENKDHIAIEAYHFNVNELGMKMRAMMSVKETATDKLVAFAEFYRSDWHTFSERGGCPILNASVEADDSYPVLKKHVRNSILNLTNELAEVIEKGKAEGEFRKELDAREYAYTFVTMIEGGIMMSKIMEKPALLDAAIDRVISMVRIEMT
ncbi:TetR/AcrR family transcriptional regulator [Limibacter armeniacum]|uniref:TetR/AcrR family transcriptional regulator n=1 Tax=Limibacter armeniacum TaxID=466084 RepID=UPI002FE56EBD